MTKRAWADWARYVFSPLALLAFVAGGVLCTLTGPFGTYTSMGFVERTVYGFSLIGVSIVLALSLKRIVDIRWSQHNFWVRSGITTFSFSFLFTGFIVMMNKIVLGYSNPADLSLWMIYGIVISVPLTVNPIIYFVLKMNGEEPDEVGDTMPRLLKRLPETIVGRLVRVSVEDHYVKVITERGSERILMRFGDALDELDEASGLRVHRSHWVAHDAVQGYWIDGSRTLLALYDGSHVPVSRNYRAQAEQAGLLANHKPRPSADSAGLTSV